MFEKSVPHAVFLKKLSDSLCLIVIGIGILTVLACQLDPHFLNQFSTDALSLNMATGLCFIFCAVAIFLFNRTPSWWAAKLGGLVVLVAYVEFVWGPHPGMHLGFPMTPLADQMPSLAMFNFFLIGCALMLLDRTTSHWYHPSEFLFLGVVLTSFFSAMGYIYNISSFKLIHPLVIPMSFTTAVSFLLLCVSGFCSRPQYGLMKTLSGDGFGSVTTRRLLPVSIFLPIVLSVLSVQGESARLYGAELSIAIYTMSIIIIFTFVIWFNAKLLNQMDFERKWAEEKTLEATKAKSEFASMVSHELRTPLTVIKESVGIVVDGNAGEINSVQKDFLDTANRNVDRLWRLINSVLDYQKLETQYVEFRMVEQDINKIIAETGQSFKLSLKNKGLELRMNLAADLPPISFDTDKIIQVLTNLLNNAMKFTEKGAITLASEKVGNNAVKVSVTDEGIGIKEEDMGKLFKGFSQISTGSGRQTGGTGLGLAISKKLIENHKGQLNVESVWGQGTTFYFILPIKDRRA